MVKIFNLYLSWQRQVRACGTPCQCHQYHYQYHLICRECLNGCYMLARCSCTNSSLPGLLQGMLSFLSAPLLGALSDVWGRKPFLLLTVTFTCAPIPLMHLSVWWVQGHVSVVYEQGDCSFNTTVYHWSGLPPTWSQMFRAICLARALCCFIMCFFLGRIIHM